MSVRLKYTGGRTGSFAIQKVGGKRLSKPYKFGNNHTNRYQNATEEDAKKLETFTYIERVQRPTTIPQNTPDIPRPSSPNIDPKAGIDPQRAGQAARVDRRALIQASVDSMTAMKAAVTAKVAHSIVEDGKHEVNITDKAAKEAEQGGLDLRTVTGTGKGGKITVMDVRNAIRGLSHA